MRSEQNLVVLKFRKWEKKHGQRNPARTGRTVLLPLVLRVIVQVRPVGVQDVPGGSTRHTAATVETMGYARAFHRAFGWQQRCRLR